MKTMLVQQLEHFPFAWEMRVMVFVVQCASCAHEVGEEPDMGGAHEVGKLANMGGGGWQFCNADGTYMVWWQVVSLSGDRSDARRHFS